MAKSIDREDSWSRLGQQALKQGNHKVCFLFLSFPTLTRSTYFPLSTPQIVEIAYQRTKNFDRLSFLYLTTGNPDKLGKMAKIAEMRGDPMSRFHNALYTGNVETRINVLVEVGMSESLFFPIFRI